MEFSRQEYWSGLPCPPPGDLPDPGIEAVSLSLLHWQVGSLPLVAPGKPPSSTGVSLLGGELLLAQMRGCLLVSSTCAIGVELASIVISPSPLNTRSFSKLCFSK